MFASLDRRRPATEGVEFHDCCGKVCTPDCRAEAVRDRVRTQAIWHLGTAPR